MTREKIEKKKLKNTLKTKDHCAGPSGVPFILNYIMIFLNYGIAPIETRRMQTRRYLDNLRAFKAFRHMRWCSFRKHSLLKSYKSYTQNFCKIFIKIKRPHQYYINTNFRQNPFTIQNSKILIKN